MTNGKIWAVPHDQPCALGSDFLLPVAARGRLSLGFLQDGDVGVGVFPEGEEIFITAASPLGLLQENNVKIEVTAQNTETLSIRRQVK